MNTRTTDQNRDLDTPYSVRRERNGAGFGAYHKVVCIGTAATEHGARVIAANHCFDTAVTKGGTYILVSLVEPTGMSPITLARVYRARMLKKKLNPHWKTTRSVNVLIEMGATRDDGYELEQLSSGEYYVCHGLRRWVLREARPHAPAPSGDEWEPGLNDDR